MGFGGHDLLADRNASSISVRDGYPAPLIEGLADQTALWQIGQVGARRRDGAQHGIEPLVHHTGPAGCAAGRSTATGAKAKSAGLNRRIIPQKAPALRGHCVTTRPLAARK